MFLIQNILILKDINENINFIELNNSKMADFTRITEYNHLLDIKSEIWDAIFVKIILD